MTSSQRLMRSVSVLFACGIALSFSAAARPSGQRARSRPVPIDASLYKAMEWRSIGPYRGGRVTAVAGIPSQPETYYFGATGGGASASFFPQLPRMRTADIAATRPIAFNLIAPIFMTSPSSSVREWARLSC